VVHTCISVLRMTPDRLYGLGCWQLLSHLEQSSLFQVVSLTWICNEGNASLHIIISSVPHVLYQGKSVVQP